MFQSTLCHRALLRTGGALVAGSAAFNRLKGGECLLAEETRKGADLRRSTSVNLQRSITAVAKDKAYRTVGNFHSSLVQQRLISVSENKRVQEWETNSEALGCTGPQWSVAMNTLHGGRQEGVDVITVDNGLLKFTILPTRGMSVGDLSLKHSKGSTSLGWASPVRENVQPSYMELNDRSGLGWLTGFNEWMVRCGVAFAGHPAIDGDHLLTLHGRIGNIPASEVEVLVDLAPPHCIRVRGRVDEAMFKFCDFELWTEVSTIPGSDVVHVEDTLVNQSDYDREYQLIYHTNFGPGSEQAHFLEAGASFHAPISQVAPFNAAAAKEIESWDTYLGPTQNYGETVYCCTPLNDKGGRTLVALVNKAGDRGVALRYDASVLPAFNLWKNTDTLREGYVTGLEPGTGFCYPRAIERAAGRVPTLAAGAEVKFALTWRVLTDDVAVNETKNEIAKIQLSKKPEVCSRPTFRDPKPFYTTPTNI